MINEQKPNYKQDLYQEHFFKGIILFIHNILIVCISVLLPVIAMLKDSDLLSEAILVAKKSIFWGLYLSVRDRGGKLQFVAIN